MHHKLHRIKNSATFKNLFSTICLCLVYKKTITETIPRPVIPKIISIEKIDSSRCCLKRKQNSPIIGAYTYSLAFFLVS